MSSKKDYETTLITLTQGGKSDSITKKLIKIQIQTEDAQLKEHLETFLSILKQMEGAPRSAIQQRSLALKKASSTLRAYCQEVLRNTKPQWQILAERHGWSPPVAKAVKRVKQPSPFEMGVVRELVK
ncbi:hypothetical protein ACFYKX_11240 [Cytobacillus sp. FJAT-54145]|uniref:Uncharacterized protein n=1 Tax=Cytobacillus spartinae TaxID=3299023 RepID=A0ABW6KBR3_9BACI